MSRSVQQEKPKPKRDGTDQDLYMIEREIAAAEDDANVRRWATAMRRLEANHPSKFPKQIAVSEPMFVALRLSKIHGHPSTMDDDVAVSDDGEVTFRRTPVSMVRS